VCDSLPSLTSTPEYEDRSKECEDQQAYDQENVRLSRELSKEWTKPWASLNLGLLRRIGRMVRWKRGLYKYLCLSADLPFPGTTMTRPFFINIIQSSSLRMNTAFTSSKVDPLK